MTEKKQGVLLCLQKYSEKEGQEVYNDGGDLAVRMPRRANMTLLPIFF